MAARDLVPFPLRPAIKRGAAFDRFADLGEHRARPLLGPGPLKQQRHPALCFLAGISRGEPFVGAERLRQATPGFENARREQIGFDGVEIRVRGEKAVEGRGGRSGIALSEFGHGESEHRAGFRLMHPGERALIEVDGLVMTPKTDAFVR